MTWITSVRLSRSQLSSSMSSRSSRVLIQYTRNYGRYLAGTRKLMASTLSHLKPDPLLVHAYDNNANTCSDLDNATTAISQVSITNWDNESAVVYPNIISESDEQNLISILETKFKRRRYEQGHWDSVIVKYREVELFDEEMDNLKSFLEPIRNFISLQHGPPDGIESTTATTNDEVAQSLYFSGDWLPCHAIDLHEDGSLNAHVDSVRFSGNLVCGLSLLSDSIMRLKPSTDNATNNYDHSDARDKPNILSNNNVQYVDMLLPTRSLYVLSGISRYKYSHELLPSGQLFRNDFTVQRGRRLSIIFRDAKK